MFFKVLAKIESSIILTNDGLYERQQWPEVVEWWMIHGDNYEKSTRQDYNESERLERIFQENNQ